MENETIDNWLCSLRDMARKSEYHKDCCAKCEPTRILQQLIYGVRNVTMRQKLLEVGPKLTIDEAMKIMRSAENARNQATDLEEPCLHLVRSTYKKKKFNTNEAKAADPNRRDQKTTCWYCGGNNRHAREDCPARDKQCNNCGKRGHYEKVCKNKTFKCNTIQISKTRPPQIAFVSSEELVTSIPRAFIDRVDSTGCCRSCRTCIVV